MGYIGSGPTKFNTADGLTVTGNAEFTGDASFGDNDKAIFGAGSDLEISHNGTENVIDSNLGTLVLRSAGAGTIEMRDQGSQVLAQFNDNSDVKLYHNNNQKLATTATGIDVTGSVTASGLTVDTSDQVIINHSGDGGGIRIDSTNGTNTGSLRFGDDADNYIGAVEYNHSTDAMSFYGNNATRMTITSSGAVGIGTASPPYKLSISENGNNFLQFNQSGDSVAGSLIGRSSSKNLRIQQSEDADIEFYTNNSENMRLNTSGRFWLGQAIGTVLGGNGGEAITGFMHHSNAANSYTVIQSNGSNNALYVASGPSGGAGLVHFGRNGSAVGSITSNGSSTSYNTSSDYRLKTAVEYDWDATTRLKQLKPARFKWIADGDNAVFVDGFLAHECGAVPEAIFGEKDAMKDEEYQVSAATGDIFTPATDDADEVIHSANVENPDTLETGQQWRETKEAVMGTRSVQDLQGIDQSKLVPLLCKTILELEARITALETA